MLRRRWLALLLLAACKSSGGGAADAGSDASASGLVVAAAQGTWSVDEDVTLSGTGAGDVGAIAVTHGVGTLDFHGVSTQVFVYDSTAVPSGVTDGGANPDGGAFAGDRDFELVGASADRLVVAWVTCSGSDLAWVYYESTDGLDSTEELAATGTCAVGASATSEAVSLPALDLPPPQVVSGFTITGPQISFDGQHPGSASFGGESYTMYPFNTVDCRECASPGWWELHSLFFSPTTRSACFAIAYLEEQQPGVVELAYALCLPGLGNPLPSDQLELDASWTAPQ